MSSCKRIAVLVFAACIVLLVVSAGTTWLDWPFPARVAGFCAGLAVGGLLLSAMLWFSPGGFHDVATPALTRRYYREFAWPMLGYVAVMLVWKRLLGGVDAVWLRVLVALLPAVLIALAIRAIARYVRDSDEMQRRIELESVALASGIVSTGYMTAGFLQSAKLLAVGATDAMLWVFPALCLCYGVTKIIIARRYA